MWLDIYNAADNFLSSTYQPLLQQYDKLLNLTVDYIGGDGQTESNITNRLGNSERIRRLCHQHGEDRQRLVLHLPPELGLSRTSCS